MSDCCNQNSKNKNTKIKLDNLDGLICYCFNHSKKELFDAVENGAEKSILEDIKSKMKSPGCFCETSNPSGKCCLVDVMAFIEAVKNHN